MVGGRGIKQSKQRDGGTNINATEALREEAAEGAARAACCIAHARAAMGMPGERATTIETGLECISAA